MRKGGGVHTFQGWWMGTGHYDGGNGAQRKHMEAKNRGGGLVVLLAITTELYRPPTQRTNEGNIISKGGK